MVIRRLLRAAHYGFKQMYPSTFNFLGFPKRCLPFRPKNEEKSLTTVSFRKSGLRNRKMVSVVSSVVKYNVSGKVCLRPVFQRSTLYGEHYVCGSANNLLSVGDLRLSERF
jgi:hypothetical protein